MLHSTPHSFAWALILSNIIPPKQRKQMENLFPNVYASFKFPRLHQLMLELESGNLESEVEQNGFDVNVQDSDGNTALHWACARGDAKAVQWLLLRGADPNIPDQSVGRTPLMAACSCVSLDCIELLLDHGAEINACNASGLNAFMYLCDEDRNPQPITEIIEAAKLLIAHGVDLYPQNANQTLCLTRAARTEIVEIMELILSQGVNINQQNQFRQTPLIRSIAWSASRSAEFLLSRGAAYIGDVATDLDGRTILHYAALNPSIKIIQVLIAARLTGLDPEVVDKAGLRAEDYVNRAEDLIDGFVPAFCHLLSEVRARYRIEERIQSELSGPDDGEYASEDEFVDALQWPTTSFLR